MRPEEEYQAALRLIEQGINDTEIGRRLGIPRGTIRDWRAGLTNGAPGRVRSRWQPRPRAPSPGFSPDDLYDREAYAYLLGIYLGDGCLSSHPRGVYRLRVSCDRKYPEIINEIAAHIVIVSGREKVGFVAIGGCVEVYAYWKSWPGVFPQHGPGKKHERPIRLVDWQREIVDARPKALIRGLIQSDGNRHINEVIGQLKDGPRRYRYPRYMFTNASSDIMTLYTDALDRLGVHWTRTGPRDVSVARRDDVAFLDTFVGPKS